ncbi:MAG: DsrE family protein [Actinomycetota bacterium]
MTITAPPDSKVLVGLSHGAEEPENVLIAYLMGVEALRAGKEAVMWLTKEAVAVAVDGAAEQIDVPGAPAIADLHGEFVDRGGRFFACPVCVKLRALTDATWSKNVEVAGAPSVYDFTAGGALVFNY